MVLIFQNPLSYFCQKVTPERDSNPQRKLASCWRLNFNGRPGVCLWCSTDQDTHKSQTRGEQTTGKSYEANTELFSSGVVSGEQRASESGELLRAVSFWAPQLCLKPSSHRQNLLPSRRQWYFWGHFWLCFVLKEKKLKNTMILCPFNFKVTTSAFLWSI